MKRLTALLLLANALSPIVWAEETKATAASETQFNELTVQYRLFFGQQQYDQSAQTAEQALTVAEQAFGPDSTQVAQVLNDLGHLHQLQGQAVRAEPLHRRALAIREQAFNHDGPAVVQSLDNLAQACQDQGHYAEAQALLERSLAIVERSVPPTAPFLIRVLEQYADALRGGGQTDKTEAVEARMARIRASLNEKAPTR